MLWLAIDVALALLALGLLVTVSLGLWRALKALSRTVSEASAAVGAVNDTLAAAQAQAPKRRGHPA